MTGIAERIVCPMPDKATISMVAQHAQVSRQTVSNVLNAPHLVALVRAGAVFHKGKLLERPVDITPTAPAESGQTDVA